MSDQRPISVDPALWRGLTQTRTTRRSILQRAAALAALGVAASACGVAGSTAGSSNSGRDWAAWWAKQPKTDQLVWANWPYYIDTNKSGSKHPSIDRFTAKTGIHVTYDEVIQDYAGFYGKISLELKAGQGTGYDMIMMGPNYYEFTELIKNGWVIPLDHSRLPNFARYASPSLKNPVYDRGNKYGIVWQSGFTGIGYNPKLTGRELTSISDLWDPKFSGHIGMFNDPVDVGCFGLLKNGVNPATATHADWSKAAATLQEQRPHVRQYYGQPYITALQQGDLWITQAYSPDIFQSNLKGFKDLKFFYPPEGAMFWHDCMMIPAHSKNPVSALEWMNFAYDPSAAAEITDWVGAVCSVPAAKPLIANQLGDPKTADSPLVFPTANDLKSARDYPIFASYDDFSRWNSTFSPIIQS
jgi:spermidine/putrescine transport system substrate-binding protein